MAPARWPRVDVSAFFLAFAIFVAPSAALGIRLAMLGEFIGIGGDVNPGLHGPILDDSLAYKLDQSRMR